jgi:hypothetical protein
VWIPLLFLGNACIDGASNQQSLSDVGGIFISSENAAQVTKSSIFDINVIMRLERCRGAMRERGEMDIVWLMRMGQVAKVGDDRDRVYGLLGLMGEKMSLNIIPDYNLRAKETYAAFTKSFSTPNKALRS